MTDMRFVASLLIIMAAAILAAFEAVADRGLKVMMRANENPEPPSWKKFSSKGRRMTWRLGSTITPTAGPAVPTPSRMPAPLPMS